MTPVCREHPPSKITEILSGNSAVWFRVPKAELLGSALRGVMW